MGYLVCNEISDVMVVKLPDQYLYSDTLNYPIFKKSFLDYIHENCPEKYMQKKKWIDKQEERAKEWIKKINEEMKMLEK